MLHIFRRSQRPLLIIILTLIIISFVGLYGVGNSYFTRKSTKTILGTYKDVELTANDLYKQERGILVDAFLRGQDLRNIRSEDVQRQALQRLILLQKAAEDGITVSTKELIDFIQNKIFGQNMFSRAAYRNMIAQNFGAMSEREFEEHVRDMLIIEKQQQSLVTGIIVTPSDIQQKYKEDNTLIKFGYVPFYLSNYISSVTIETNEVEDFYYQNQNDFTIPEKVTIAYTIINPTTNNVIVDAQDAEFYYENHYDDFTVTNTTISATGTNTVVDVLPYSNVVSEIYSILTFRRAEERARDKADILYLRTSEMTNPDIEERITYFSEEADKLDLDVKRTSFLTQGEALPGISNSSSVVTHALTMDAGTVSDVKLLPDGSLILFAIADKKPSYIPDLSEAWSNAYERIAREKAFQMTANVAQRIKNQIDKSTNDFITEVTRIGLKPFTSPPLSRNDNFTRVNCMQQIVGRLFAFPEGSTVVAPFTEGAMIVSPLKIYPADLALLYVEEEDLYNRTAQIDMTILYQGYVSKAMEKARINQNALNRIRGISPEDENGQ